jgi:site-specific recombinase XerD
MRETRDGTTPSLTLEKGLAIFVDALAGKNRSQATIRAYQTDLLQFIRFLHDTNVLIASPKDVQKVDILDYFSHLAKKDLTGVARARKMSAIREYFRFLEGLGQITKSPTTGVETPKRERNTRQFLRSDEYTKMGCVAKTGQRSQESRAGPCLCGHSKQLSNHSVLGEDSTFCGISELTLADHVHDFVAL